MNLRKRKKEPPDPLLSIFDFPLASSYLVDLANSLPISRSLFPAIPFPCPILDFALSSVSKFYLICSPPQPVVGVQITTRRFRNRLSSASIIGNYCVQTLSGCCGLPGSTCGSSSAPLMVLILQFRGPRSVIVERSYQGWHVRSLRVYPSFGRILVFASLVAHNVCVDALYQPEMGSCFFTEHGATEWPLLAISFIFHLAVFRSEAQVCFFTFPLQACYCICLLCKSGALVPFSRLLLMRSLAFITFNGVLWVVWGWSLGRLDCSFRDPSPPVFMFGLYYVSLIGLVSVVWWMHVAVPLGLLLVACSLWTELGMGFQLGNTLYHWLVINASSSSMAPDKVGIITLSHGINYLRIMVRDLTLVMVESPKRLHTINYDGVLVDRVHHLQRGVYLIMVHMLPEWQRPNVRYYFCRLVFRSVHQGLWSSNPYSQPLCMRPCLLFAPNQHAIMCRMPVGTWPCYSWQT